MRLGRHVMLYSVDYGGFVTLEQQILKEMEGGRIYKRYSSSVAGLHKRYSHIRQTIC